MRWYNHKLSTAATVYAFSGDVIATSIAVAGAVFPDSIEFPFKGLLPHRTVSHWPYPYILFALAFYAHYIRTQDFLSYYLSFFLVGALLHLSQDFLSKGGIPFGSPFGKRKGLNFYKIHTLREVYTTLGIVVPCGLIAWLRGGISSNHFLLEFEKAKVFAQYLQVKLF